MSEYVNSRPSTRLTSNTEPYTATLGLTTALCYVNVRKLLLAVTLYRKRVL